jgi:AcrR family transcriptional regulator
MVRGAAELLRRRGYSGTGFREVIELTGAPRGSIYHHFPGGKAELAGEAVGYVGSLARETIEGSLADGDPIAALRAFVQLWRADFERSGYRAGCPIVAVAVESHDEAPELLDAAADAFAQWESAFAGALRRAGVARGRAQRLASLVVSAVEGAIVVSRARRDPGPLLDVARELEATLADAIAEARPAVRTARTAPDTGSPSRPRTGSRTR